MGIEKIRVGVGEEGLLRGGRGRVMTGLQKLTQKFTKPRQTNKPKKRDFRVTLLLQGGRKMAFFKK